MTLPAIDDPDLRGLGLLAEPGALMAAIDDALAEATVSAWRCHAADIVRFRYRAGRRAILQLDLTLCAPDGRQHPIPGALWLHQGGKAKDKVPKAQDCDPAVLPGQIFEPRTSGLLTLFPHDRRVPEIARFSATAAVHAEGLTGAAALSAPKLSRYRPGLGATFRWQTTGGVSFVKIFNDRPASDRHAELAALYQRIQSRALATPVPRGFDDVLCAVALHQASGIPLADSLLADEPAQRNSAIEIVLGALDALNRLDLVPRRALDCNDLLKRAQSVVILLGAVDCDLAARACAALARLAEKPPPLRQTPVHMDMKIEHVLIDGPTACLLDLDSLALCDPLYDPAMLAARIELAGLEGTMPEALCQTAIEALRAATPIAKRPVFDWLLSIARFQTARFLLQNVRPDWQNHVSTLMRGIAARTPHLKLCG